MAVERQDTETDLPAVDAALETAKVSPAQVTLVGDETLPIVNPHLSIAARLLREGSPGRAFSELVRAAREAPLTARLAASLVRVALLANNPAPAVTLLSDAATDAEGSQRAGILRALARLHRRSDGLEAARERLVVLLADRPSD